MSTYFSPKMSYTQSNKMFKKPFADCKISSRKSSFPLNPESFMAQASKPGIPYLSASKLKTMTLSNDTNKQLITSLMLGNKGMSRSQYYTKLNQSHTRLEKPVEGYRYIDILTIAKWQKETKLSYLQAEREG